MSVLRRHTLTLIELLIVIIILIMVGGIAGINVVEVLKQQRFNSEVNSVVDQLRLAQDLMLLMPGDFHVKLTPKDGSYLLEVDTDAVLTEGWSKELKRQRRPLKEIRFIKFDDAVVYPSAAGTVDVKFLSGGSLMSKGVLELSANPRGGGTLAESICLYGYPHPIEVLKDKKCKDKEAEMYDERLTGYTLQEISEADLDVAAQKQNSK